ncbi:MAG: helix-turn-helix domain-containing protein [Ruminococcaceae bacterium]|nr:helix-turn-helix domain-containing protein [Oscillospiraceae bacterium]
MKIRYVSKSYKTMSIISYCIVAFLLIFFALTVIVAYHSSLKKTSEAFNEYIVDTVTSSFEDSVWSMKNFQRQLLLNEKLSDIISQKNDNYFYNDTTWEMLEDIKEYASYDNKIDLFFIYLKETDSVLCKTGIVHSKLFHDAYFAETGISYEDWKSVVSKDINRDIYGSMTYSGDLGKPVDTIMLMGCIPDSSGNNFVVLSNKQNFIGGLSTVTWEPASDIFIYNAYGRLAIHEKKTKDDVVPQTITAARKYSDNSYSMFISPISMLDGNWYIALRVPQNELNLRTIVLKNGTVFAGIIALIILSLLIRYLLRINYTPIKRLVDVFGTPGEKGEFEFLHDSIENIFLEKDKMATNLKAVESKLQASSFPQIIQGNMSSQLLDEYNAFFEDKEYILAVFYLNSLSSFFAEDEQMSNFEKMYHLSYIINNVMSELFARHNTEIFSASADAFNLCLVGVNETCNVDRIRQTALEGVRFINEQFSINLEIKFSESCEGILRLPSLFEKLAEEFRMPQKNEETYSFNIYKERGLVQSIKIGNKEDALSIVSELLQDVEAKAERCYFNFVVLDIISTITKILAESTNDNIELREFFDFYKDVSSSMQSTQQITKQLMDFVKRACDIFADDVTRKRSRTVIHAEEIQKYIEENFADQNLCIEMIAHHFNLSKPHVSKIFKESTGMTVLSYINNVRMAYANKLIKEGKFSLEKIAQMSGFGNVRSLYRLRNKNKE